MTTSQRVQGEPQNLVLLMPVFQDFAAAGILCQQLDRELSRVPNLRARVLLVDDGSTHNCDAWPAITPQALVAIEHLRLRRNLGHQRAIAIGLCHLFEHGHFDLVVVMDADGEDRPEDVPRLIDAWRRAPESVVFAERRRRFEGGLFRVGYFGYRSLHRLLTGVAVRVGNFSLLPSRDIGRLVHMSELWNHYAGAIFRSRLPQVRVIADRGRRITGRSQMGGLIPLVMHGIAGIATFSDVVATRVLIASTVAVAGLTMALLAALIWPLGTGDVRSWSMLTVALLLMIVLQVASVAFGLVLSLIGGRTASSFVPARDYAVFIDGITTLWSRHDQ